MPNYQGTPLVSGRKFYIYMIRDGTDLTTLAASYPSCDTSDTLTFYNCFPNTDDTYLIRMQSAPWYPTGYTYVGGGMSCCTAYNNFLNYSGCTYGGNVFDACNF